MKKTFIYWQITMIVAGDFLKFVYLKPILFEDPPRPLF